MKSVIIISVFLIAFFQSKIGICAADEPKIDTVTEDELVKMKAMILNQPEMLQSLLTDPVILSRFSNFVLQSVNINDLLGAVSFLSEADILLQQTYPHNYEEVVKKLLKIQDEETKITLENGLKTIIGVISSKSFQAMLVDLLSSGAFQNSKEASNLPNVSEPAIDKVNPTEVRNGLQKWDIIVTEEKAKEILVSAKHGQLISKLLNFVNEAKDTAGNKGLTAEKLSREFAQHGIEISSYTLKKLMINIAKIGPNMIQIYLKNLGIDASLENLKSLVNIAEEISLLTNTGESRHETPTSEFTNSLPSQQSPPPAAIDETAQEEAPKELTSDD